MAKIDEGKTRKNYFTGIISLLLSALYDHVFGSGERRQFNR